MAIRKEIEKRIKFIDELLEKWEDKDMDILEIYAEGMRRGFEVALLILEKQDKIRP